MMMHASGFMIIAVKLQRRWTQHFTVSVDGATRVHLQFARKNNESEMQDTGILNSKNKKCVFNSVLGREVCSVGTVGDGSVDDMDKQKE